MTSVLLLVRAAPAANIRAREALDAALLFSAFTPALTVLFSGEGVWQVLRAQQPEAVGAAAVARVIGAFGEYDITAVYADGSALAQRGIGPGHLLNGITVLDDAGIRALIAGHDRVLSF